MKFNKAILYMAFAAASFGLAACSTDGYWDEAPQSALTTYTFVQSSNSYSVSASEPMTQIPVSLCRSTTKGEETLPVTVESESDVLSGPDTVTFQDGENVATYYVEVGNAEVGVEYTATLSISEDVTSTAGKSSMTVSYTVNYNWVSAGSATFYNYWFESLDEDGNIVADGVKVNVEKAEGGNGLYRLVDPFYYAGVADGSSRVSKGYNFEFYVDEATGAAKYPASSVNEMAGYYYSGYGYFYFYYSYKGSYGCAFLNDGKVYTMYGLTANGSSASDLSLYDYDQIIFVWNDGYPW